MRSTEQTNNTFLATVSAVLIGLGTVGSTAQAQTQTETKVRGSVEIVQDPLITVLQKFRAGKLGASTSTTRPTEPVDRSTMTRTTARGFRVQIFLGPSRSDAYAAQARFRQLFNTIDTYIVYDEPNYRVKVGDFRSRSEAEKLMQSLRQQFNNVFIFTEDIFVYH